MNHDAMNHDGNEVVVAVCRDLPSNDGELASKNVGHMLKYQF